MGRRKPNYIVSMRPGVHHSNNGDLSERKGDERLQSLLEEDIATGKL